MARKTGKGIGIHRTIYFPVDIITTMGIAMAATKEPRFNRFVNEAVAYYCNVVLDREKEGELNNGKGEASED